MRRSIIQPHLLPGGHKAFPHQMPSTLTRSYLINTFKPLNG